MLGCTWGWEAQPEPKSRPEAAQPVRCPGRWNCCGALDGMSLLTGNGLYRAPQELLDKLLQRVIEGILNCPWTWIFPERSCPDWHSKRLFAVPISCLSSTGTRTGILVGTICSAPGFIPPLSWAWCSSLGCTNSAQNVALPSIHWTKGKASRALRRPGTDQAPPHLRGWHRSSHPCNKWTRLESDLILFYILF